MTGLLMIGILTFGIIGYRALPVAALPNVEVSGFVQDLPPVYERAAFTVAPIYWGGGTKIKVLESLAYGRTCVASATTCSHTGSASRVAVHSPTPTSSGSAVPCSAVSTTRTAHDPTTRRNRHR